MNDTSALPDRATLFAFAAIVCFGGTNFVAVKFSNAELPPLFGAGIRFALAAFLLVGIMRLRRLAVPRGRALAGAALFGALSFGLVYGLLYFALLGVSAGTTSVVMAAVPLATLVIAVWQGQEQFSLRGVIGGALALAGIGVLSLRSLGGDVPLASMLAAVGAMLAASQAAVLVKSFPRTHPITTNAIGMSVGAAGLLLASRLFGEAWRLPAEPQTWAALSWLVLIGSVAMFGLFVFVLKTWKASAGVYVLTLMPLVAGGLGALLLGEPVTAEMIGGGALVLLGVYVGAISGVHRPRIPRSAVAATVPAESK